MDTLNSFYYKNLTKHFSPTSAWSNSYWESPIAPYNFTDEEKILLKDIYDQLDNVWFKAISSKMHGIISPRITLSHAIWICILCDINPKLKTTAVDVWIMSEYLSSSYINALLNKTIDPSANPIDSADASALKYIEKEPYSSLENAQSYNEAINNKLINPVASTWHEIGQDYTEGINDYILDYPMLRSSQISSSEYMPRYQTAICTMARICIKIIKQVESIEPKDATDITYRLKLPNFGNDLETVGKNSDYGYNFLLGRSIKKECKEIIRKLSTTNKSLSNRKSDNWESSNDLSFPFEAIGPYYSLMKSLLRLLESKGDSTNISINTSTLDHTLTMTKHPSMPVGALFYELAPKYALEQKNLYELYIYHTK